MDNINLLEQQAIEAAIKNRFNEAIKFNRQIIRLDKKNIDAYLRLGFAYLQTKKIKEAEKCYKKILKIQPSNYTAQENLERIKIIKAKKIKLPKEKNLDLHPDLFLETPDRTKSVTLVNLGQKNILVQLAIGQKMILLPKKRRLEIRTMKKEYIGCLPDDLSRRLIILMKGGSEFTAYIKEAGLKKVVVFLKEVKRGKKVWKYSPFPTNTNLKPLVSTKIEETDEEENEEELTEADLEVLAENLISKEKEENYLSFTPKDEDEEDEE